MATKDINKFLDEMKEFIAREYKRGALDKFSTKVKMTAEGFAQGFKEGYNSLQGKKEDWTNLDDTKVFKEAGEKAVEAVAKWAQNPRSRGVITEYIKNKVVCYRASRDIKVSYRLAKNAGVAHIQLSLLKMGKRKLAGANKEKGISARGSEVGLVKSAIHRAHQGATTVGAAQLSAGLRFLEQTRAFAGFATSEAASDIADIIQDIKATFETSGTKSGSKASVVSIKENVDVGIEVLPRSLNPRGAEDFDFNNLLPEIEKAIKRYVEKEGLEILPGSQTIIENAVNAALFQTVTTLTKSKNVKEKGKKVKHKGRKRKNVSVKEAYAARKMQKSTKRGKAARNVRQTVSSSPLRLIGLINKKLPDTVRKNMNAPALQNRTGRFAESVKLTEVVETPKGFPSFGYTYQRNPYQRFEIGTGEPPWATPERDPRKLIELSIREIASQFAIGRFYTRRV